MRKTSEELEVIKKKHGVDQLWSWSRYNCYKTSTYEYYLKYVAKVKEDRFDGIYGLSGNICHYILEKYFTKEIKYEDMLPEYEEELFKLTVGDFKYNRSDDEKNAAIADKYEACIRHFFTNYIPTTQKVDIERFILIKVGKFLFQGYVDCVHKEGKEFIITDFKTSSIYTGAKINSERGQLLLYAEGLHQLGVPLENIKIRWNFLKYVTVETQLANKKIAFRNISRHEIGSCLAANAKMWLKKTKRYTDEEVDGIVELLIDSNDVKTLPEDIQLKFKVADCYVYIDFGKEDIDELKNNIIDTINEIKEKEEEYNKTKDDKVFWEEVTDKSSYYFSNLSGFSPFHHKPYAEYLDKLKSKKGSSDDNSEKEDDLSWLTELD